MNNKRKFALVLLSAVFLFTVGCENSKHGRGGIVFEKCEKENFLSEQVQTESVAEPVADTPENIPEYSEPVYEKVSFAGCGDNIIYYGNVRDAASLSDGTRKYNFKPMFSLVSDIISNADIAFINQETVMAGDGYDISYYPRFNSPRDLGYDLCELGFDVINIANNHMLDKGADGLLKTVQFWKSQPCLMIGGYEDDADYDTVRILERNGIKIAFLSYTWFTNGISKPASSPLAIPYTVDEDMKRQCERALSEAEFLIVSVHWGNEGAFVPNSEQRRIAGILADSGADVIIGHHPHVIQPVEWIYGKNGNKTLCVFSLGNFAAEQAYAYNMAGGIIKFDIVSKDNMKPYVENPEFVPTVFHFDSKFYNNTVYPMSEYTEELASVHGVRTYYKNPITLKMLRGYVDKYISDEFLKSDQTFFE